MSVKRLVPLHAVVLDDNPTTGRIGDIYFNSVSEELRYFDGVDWNPVAGAISGLLDHVHAYDGAIYSISSVEIPNPGIVDGGNPLYAPNQIPEYEFLDGGDPSSGANDYQVIDGGNP